MEILIMIIIFATAAYCNSYYKKAKIANLNLILKYIEKLESESYQGWHPEACKGYKTACISIKEKIKKLEN